jgi:hypothetical protein
MFLRLLMSVSGLFLSLVLGAVMMGVVGYNSPEALSYLLGWARDLKGAITGTGLDPKYNIWVEVLLEERQLLFMFFTIAARIVLAMLAGIFTLLFRRG